MQCKRSPYPWQIAINLEEIKDKENKKQETKQEQLIIKTQLIELGRSEEYFDKPETYFKDMQGRVLAARIRLTLTYSGVSAKQVTLQFDLPECLKMDRNPILIDTLKGGGTPYSDEIILYGNVGLDPNNLNVAINASLFN